MDEQPCDYAECGDQATRAITFVAEVGFYCEPHAQIARDGFLTLADVPLPRL